MSCLSVYNDLITELQEPPAAVEEQHKLVAETESPLGPSVVNVTPDGSPGVARKVTDVIKVTDVATLLSHREFKIHS